jgi:hypothetical protein
MRVTSWNLQARRNGWLGRFEDRVRLLAQQDEERGLWEIFFAQEVPPGRLEQFAEATNAADARHAWHDDPGKDERTATAAAVLVRDPLADHRDHHAGSAIAEESAMHPPDQHRVGGRDCGCVRRFAARRHR